MAGLLPWKVYRDGIYVAQFRFADDAAAFVALEADAAERDCDLVIKSGHNRVVWSEGRDDFSARGNVAQAAELIEERARTYLRRKAIKAGRAIMKKHQDPQLREQGQDQQTQDQQAQDEEGE